MTSEDINNLIEILARYSTIPNDGESFDDIVKAYDEIIRILNQYAEIKLCVDEFYKKTAKEKPIETPIELSLHLKTMEAHERCLANQLLGIFKENTDDK